MYSNIIVPVAFDDDHNPDAALNIARALAAPGARVTLVHVMADVPGFAISYMPEGYAADLKRTLQGSLDQLANEFENGAGVIREQAGTYMPAFVIAGAFGIAASMAFIAGRRHIPAGAVLARP